jgi:nicotinate phosphoribosyltransferase
MAYSFFESGMHNDHIACELFYRKCPFGGEYTIFGGLGDALTYIQNFRFTVDEVEYLR